MKKQIVIINGSGGAGKDTFVKLCSEFASIKNYSSVQEIKDLATQIGWDGQKTEKDRKFLSELKRLTTEYNDFAYNNTCAAIETFLKDSNSFLFIHIREPLEIQKLLNKYPNIKTLLIVRADEAPIVSNLSDANVANYQYDYLVTNEGTIEDLKNDAHLFIDILKYRMDEND